MLCGRARDYHILPIVGLGLQPPGFSKRRSVQALLHSP